MCKLPKWLQSFKGSLQNILGVIYGSWGPILASMVYLNVCLLFNLYFLGCIYSYYLQPWPLERNTSVQMQSIPSVYNL